MLQDHRLIWRGLPRLDINLDGGKQQNQINREQKFTAKATLVNANHSEYTSAQLYSGNITIKGRGNGTWLQPKKPYNIVLLDSAAKKLDVPLLGMPAESEWSLLAEYQDRTYSRNSIAMAISYALGLPWASRMRKVELYINNQYQGMYTLCEKVKIGKDRIDIDDLKATDISGSNLTGGYVIEQQQLFQIPSTEAKFQDATFSFWYSFKAPDGEKIKTQQVAYAKETIDGFYSALMGTEFTDPEYGYRSKINAESFAKFYLLQDLVKNLDMFNNSNYFTKHRNGKLDAGPGWDFDISLAISGVAPWTGTLIDWSIAEDTVATQKSPVYARLMSDPYFSDLVKQTFLAAYSKLHDIIADLGKYTEALIASGGPERDTNNWVEGEYNSVDIDKVLTFVRNRIYWQTRKLYDIIPAVALSES